MTITVLARNWQSGRAIARMLGVDGKAVRYHLHRQAAGTIDGRSRQVQQAAKLVEAIADYVEKDVEGPVEGYPQQVCKRLKAT